MGTISTLVKKLDFAHIENIEQIASRTRNPDYAIKLATEMARQKISTSGFTLAENYTFTFRDGLFIAQVSPFHILENTHKSQLDRHAKSQATLLKQMHAEGIIHFLPFLMNSAEVRDYLEERIPIGFVNLHYDLKSMERRIRQYANRG